MDMNMYDQRGRPVAVPVIEMQDEGQLRHMITSGDRVAECFAEIKRRRERVHAAMRAIHGPDWVPAPRQKTSSTSI